MKEHFWQREAFNMSHLIEVISAQNPRISKGICTERLICMSVGYLSLIIFFVVLLPLSFTVWMSIKAFPLLSGEWLTRFTVELEPLSTD